MFSCGDREKPLHSLTPTHSIINTRDMYLACSTSRFLFLFFFYLIPALDGRQARQLLAAFSSCLVCLAAFMGSSWVLS